MLKTTVLILLAAGSLPPASGDTEYNQRDIRLPDIGSIPHAVSKRTRLRRQLIEGVLAVRGHMKHVTRDYATQVVDMVLDVSQQPENRWLTPWLLLGLAINESDLRPHLKAGYDCGITQIRATVFNQKKRPAEFCQQLADSPEMALSYTADVLRGIRDRYCKFWWDKVSSGDERYEWKFRRCLLNVYNQGPWYYRAERCDSLRCNIKARYYLRVSCFAAAVLHGKRTRACRRVWSNRWIRHRFPGTHFFNFPNR